jgi:hypothetical protein
MARVLLLWAGSLGALAVFVGGASATAGGASCSTHGLAFSTVRVVGLEVRGVACSKARAVAGAIAHELARGRPVSVDGAEGLSLSEESCTGCKTTTSVSIRYGRGQIAVSIRGGSGASGTPPLVPGFPGDPSGSGSSGEVI